MRTQPEIAAFLHDIRHGLPREDAAALHGLDEDELELLEPDMRRAEAQLSQSLTTTLVTAAEMGDWKAALAVLERRNKGYARQSKADVSAVVETVSLELPSNGRQRH